MALIAMCTHDTEENGRAKLTKRTLRSLAETVDFSKHRLFIFSNVIPTGGGDVVSDFIRNVNPKPIWILSDQNIGTANGINKCWQYRKPGEHCIKMDNDVVIHQTGWVDEMEEAIQREPSIGIVGLKRKDIWECPWHESPFFRSKLSMLPHEVGQRWIIIEKVPHVIGTCQMYNSALLDKMGYLYQEGVYGFDDAFSAHRCTKAGMINCFLPHIEIDHIDPGGDKYSQWKIEQANEYMDRASQVMRDYDDGTRHIYYDGGFTK